MKTLRPVLWMAFGLGLVACTGSKNPDAHKPRAETCMDPGDPAYDMTSGEPKCPNPPLKDPNAGKGDMPSPPKEKAKH